SGSGGNSAAAEPTTPPQAPQADTPEPTATPALTEDADEQGFDPAYQIDAGSTVNLRQGPWTATSIIDRLPPATAVAYPRATPLEYLNEDAPTDSPGDGERWMKFETEDGLVGWVREIDVTEYVP